MALPSFNQAVTQVVIPVGEADVTFQIRPVPAAVLNRLRDEHRTEDGNVTIADLGPGLLEHGLCRVYSSIESTPRPVEADDVDEIVSQWPEWAVTRLVAEVWQVSTRGPASDPKDG